MRPPQPGLRRSGSAAAPARNARPYGARAQPRIEDRDDAAVGVAADQPAEALPQLQHRGRQRVVAEPVAAETLDRLAARLVQRVARRRERQLVDHEQRQRLARHVDALPERRRREQHRADLVAEPLEQALARRLTLHEHVVRHAAADLLAVDLERAVARREHERAPLGEREQRDDLVGRALGEVVAARIGHRARQVEQAPARGSRTASRRRPRAPRSSPSRRRTKPASSPVVSVAETRIAVGPSSQSRSRSSVETSTGAQASASGSAQTTRSSSPGSRQRLDLARDGERAAGERVEVLALALQRVREVAERVDQDERRLGRHLAQPLAARRPARPRAAAARRCARRGRAAGPGTRAAPRGRRARRRREPAQPRPRDAAAEPRGRGLLEPVRLVEDHGVVLGQHASARRRGARSRARG